MRSSMSVSIKIFFRSIVYLAICAVLFLLSNFFLMRFFNASNYLAEFHVTSLKLGIVGYIVFSFLSYEYTNQPQTSALQEALEIIPSSRSKLLCSQSIVLRWGCDWNCYALFCVIVSPCSSFLSLSYTACCRACLLSSIFMLIPQRRAALLFIWLKCLFPYVDCFGRWDIFMSG